MFKKLTEFVDTMLFDNQEIDKEDMDKIKFQLSELLAKKTKALIKALFSFDKLQWYKYLINNFFIS